MKIRRWAWIAFACVCLLATGIGLLSRPVDNLALVVERYHPKITNDPDGTVHYVFPVAVSEDEVRTSLDVSAGRLAFLNNECLEVLKLQDGRWVEMSYSNGGGYCQLHIALDKRSWFERAWSALTRRFRP